MNHDALCCDSVCELCCNLDDMSPEAIAYAMEVLGDAGALDVFTIPIGMKKCRPATMLCCLCHSGEEERFARLILRHTSTLGVRMQTCQRWTLPRHVETVGTAFGPVRVKRSFGLEESRCKAEFEDLARIARQTGLPLQTVAEQVNEQIKQKEGALMRELYFDCSMGAAGDMLMAALYELLEDKKEFLHAFAALELPGVRLCPQTRTSGGVSGTQMRVLIDGQEESDLLEPHGHGHDHHGHHDHHDHHHHSYANIQQLLDRLPLPAAVRENAQAVYALLAQAESEAHGVPVTTIHFHEVGQIDAVCDIVGCCMLLERLAPACVTASAVHVGCGKVQCAHGLLDVPAPATARLLEQIPTYGGEIEGELCTPTGAALLRHFVSAFDCPPPAQALAVGTGVGSKEFARPNCLRAYLL